MHNKTASCLCKSGIAGNCLTICAPCAICKLEPGRTPVVTGKPAGLVQTTTLAPRSIYQILEGGRVWD
nr:MAG TPA: hypothetical protein [Caudoviricetes sp.]